MRGFARAAAIGCLVAATVLSSVVSASAAPADITPGMPACSVAGNPIDTYPVPGAPATLKLWYDSARGTNCARLVHTGSSVEVATPTMVRIWTCTTSTDGAECFRVDDAPPYFGHDDGNYEYYAGTVSVTGRDRCIYARGYMDWGGARHSVNTGLRADGRPAAHHCD